MPELTVADVERYTSGRLDSAAEETQRLLSAGLAAARRFCGWHVTPTTEDDEVTLDGPGSTLLVLPTLRLVELTSVVENSVPIDAADVYVSTRGLVRKRSGTRWSDRFAAIVVTMDHGFGAAPDFDAAVLSFVDRISFAAAGGRPNAVGPFRFDPESMAASSAFSAVERSLLDQYRLESAP